MPPLSQVRANNLIRGLFIIIGEIPVEQISPIMTGQNVNMRLFEARVASLVKPNQRTISILRMHMSQYYDFGRTIHRMDLPYIKIINYALMRHRFDVEGLIPVIQPFQVGSTYHHFNTAPDVDWDEAEIEAFKNAQCRMSLHSFVWIIVRIWSVLSGKTKRNSLSRCCGFEN